MKPLVAVLFAFTALGAKAQSAPPSQKIGHADWNYIFTSMPAYKQIEKEIKTFEVQLQNQLNAKAQELETKYKAYQALDPATPDAIRKDKESELAYLRENFQTFQEEAQTSMQKKRKDLVAPVFAMVGEAIEQVAIENGFSYIINPQMMNGGDVLLFTDEKYNISDLVLEKLQGEATSK